MKYGKAPVIAVPTLVTAALQIPVINVGQESIASVKVQKRCSMEHVSSSSALGACVNKRDRNRVCASKAVLMFLCENKRLR
jgi:hypothetical protein